VLGAAILGAFGAGAFSSIEEAVGAMVQVEADFEPKQMNHTLYDDQHQIYRGLYEAIASAGQYQKLADFSARYY
jgi:xylulokinase